jgi:hypothetical protein
MAHFTQSTFPHSPTTFLNSATPNPFRALLPAGVPASPLTVAEPHRLLFDVPEETGRDLEVRADYRCTGLGPAPVKGNGAMFIGALSTLMPGPSISTISPKSSILSFTGNESFSPERSSMVCGKLRKPGAETINSYRPASHACKYEPSMLVRLAMKLLLAGWFVQDYFRVRNRRSYRINYLKVNCGLAHVGPRVGLRK